MPPDICNLSREADLAVLVIRPKRPLIKSDSRLIRRSFGVVWNRHQRRNQVFVSVRVLREDLDDVPVGIAVGKLEYVISSLQGFARNLHWRTELEFRLLVPLICQDGLRHE